jgi:3-oxo-5-alpha-steroid 4-dehydrogenase 1
MISGFKHSLPAYLFFLAWMLHYLNRSFIYPSRIKTKGKKMPLSIMFMAIFFNFMNGFLNGFYLGNLSHYNLEYLLKPHFLLGGALFLTGLVVNIQSDTILISLRDKTTTTYAIPKGKLFKYISCPNHFGEMLEWAGFALMTFCLPALAFFIWTVINLLPRSLAHHKWYHKNFPDYPENRKAVIPFIL